MIKSTGGSFALKISNAALRFLVSLLLARILGASGFGAYSLALSWVGILSVPAALGFDRLLVREIAVYRGRSEWGLMRGVLARTNQAALGASLLLALAMGLVTWALSGRLEPQVLYSLWVAAALIPLTAFVQLRQAAGALLVTSGNERSAARGIGCGEVLNVCLNAALIPSLVIEGAAIATTSSTVVWNLLLRKRR